MEEASFTAYCPDSRPPASDLHALISIAECIIEYLRVGCEQLSEDQLAEVRANGGKRGANQQLVSFAQIMLRAGIQSRQTSIPHTSSTFDGVLKRIPRYHALLKASADTPCKGSSKRQDEQALVTSAFAKELHYTSKYREGHFRAAVFTGHALWHHGAAQGPTAPLALVLFPPNHSDSRVTHVFLPTGGGARAHSADSSWPSAAGYHAPSGALFSTCDGLRPAQQLLLTALGLPASPPYGDPPLIDMSSFHITVLRRRGSGKGGASSAGGGTLGAFSVGSVPSVLAAAGAGKGGQYVQHGRLSPVPDEDMSPAASHASPSRQHAAVAPPPQAAQSPPSRGAEGGGGSSYSSPKRVRVGKKHKKRKGHSRRDAGAASGGRAHSAMHLGDTVAFDAADSVPWAHATAAHSRDEPMRVSHMASPVKGAVRAGQEAAALVRTLHIPGVTGPRRGGDEGGGLPSPGRPGTAKALGEVIAATWSSLEGRTTGGEPPLTPSAEIPWTSPQPPLTPSAEIPWTFPQAANQHFHAVPANHAASPHHSSVLGSVSPSGSSSDSSAAHSAGSSSHPHSPSQGGVLLSFSPPRPSSPVEGKSASPGRKGGHAGSLPPQGAFAPPEWYSTESGGGRHTDTKAADATFNPPESPPQNAEQRSRYKRYAALRAKKAKEDEERKQAWAARKRGEGGSQEDTFPDKGKVSSPGVARVERRRQSAGAVSPTADLELDVPPPAAATARGGSGGAYRGTHSPPQGLSHARDSAVASSDLARSMSRGGASNAPRVRNALKFVCLAGPNRAADLREALDAMRGEEQLPEGGETNFVVLFRTPAQLLYKGLYAYHVPSGNLRRIHGKGPAVLPPGQQRDARVKAYYKFSTGARQFQIVHTRAMTVSIDGIALSLPPSKQPTHPPTRD